MMFFIGQDVVTMGADYYVDKATKDNSGIIDEKIDNIAAFFQYQMKVKNGELLFSGRRDDHSEFGVHDTWNVAWGYDATADARLTVSYGEAFKAPTVNDLFWPYSSSDFFGTTYVAAGNQNLEPEKSNTLEISMRQRLGESNSISAAYFHTKITDMIDWVTTETGVNEYTSTPSNTQEVSIDGVEVELNTFVGKWQLNSTISLIQAIDKSRGQQLDRRPKESLSITGSRHANKHSYYVELFVASERLDRNGSAELSGYGITNLSYQLAVDDETSLSARINNVFDKEYVLATSFSGDWNAQERTIYLTLSHKL